MRIVPDLAGMELGVALNTIAGDFTGLTTEDNSETVEPAWSFAPTRAAGVEVEKDATITLVVSNGPAPRQLEELAGLTVAAATAKLDHHRASSPSWPGSERRVRARRIRDQLDGARVAHFDGRWHVTKGTEVQLVPSAGPAPRTVPDLTGVTIDVATQTLADLSLTLTPLPDEFSSTIPAGGRRSSGPSAGHGGAPRQSGQRRVVDGSRSDHHPQSHRPRLRRHPGRARGSPASSSAP